MVTPMSEPPITPADLEFVNRPISRKAVSALAMRVAGHSLDDIVQVVGFASPEEATRAIDKALRDELRASPRQQDKMRGLVKVQLDRLLRSVAPKAFDPNSPEHLPAVGKAREIIGDIRKLYGIDAPTQMVVHNPGDSEIEQWVMTILGQSTDDESGFDVLEGEVVSSEDEDPDDGVPALIGA